MMAAMMTVANPGDKVIACSPFYENYGADAILSGAESIYVPLTPPNFGFDPEVLEAAFKQHPKDLILCNPSNPCGKVFTYEELKIIAQLAEKYDAFVITDDYRDRKFIPLYGILMEVTTEQYIDFYRTRNRQRYLEKRSAEKGEISIDMLTMPEFNGENILISEEDVRTEGNPGWGGQRA